MTTETTATDVLLVSADLFLGSRVRGAIESQGWTLETAGTGARAVERLQSGKPYGLVLVDLETPALQIESMSAARAEGAPPIIAYGPHVHEKRLDAARTAGCDRVLTRGQFNATLSQLLKEFLTRD